MTTRNFLLKTKWLLCGDVSRFTFAQWITGRSSELWRQIEEPVWLEYGQESLSSDGQKSSESFRSRRMPAGISACLFPETIAENVWQKQEEACCAVFETFPWQKDSTMKLLDDWQKLPLPRPILVLVLMDLPRQHGSTDLDDPLEALESARRGYEADGYDVRLIRTAADVMEVFSVRKSLLLAHRDFLKAELENLQEKILQFRYDYSIEFLDECESDETNGCLSLRARDVILSYKAARGSGETNPWHACNKAALKELFPTGQRKIGTFHDLLQRFEDILCGDRKSLSLPVMSGWDMAETRKQLKAALEKKFASYMSPPKKYAGKISWTAIRDNRGYRKLFLPKGPFEGMGKEYMERLKTFVEEEAKAVVIDSLERCCTAWKGMVV